MDRTDRQRLTRIKIICLHGIGDRMRNMSLNCLLPAVLFAIASGLTPQSSFADEIPEISVLSARRFDIKLPVYTPDEKQMVAEQAQTILRDVYVNREVKIEAYGPLRDPVPKIAEVVSQARRLSDAALHRRISDIFASQHDLHLSYSYPVPHSCFRSVLPFSLVKAKDATGQTVIAVESLTKNAAIWDLVPQARIIEVGDVLLAYDNRNPNVTISALAKTSRGSNEFGRVRRAIENMTFRSHRSSVVPERDVVQLKFQNRIGAVYEIDVPWLARADLKCLTSTRIESLRDGVQKIAGKELGFDEYQIEFEEFYKPHRRESTFEILTDTEEPIIHYDLIQNDFGKFGILRLDSFSPQKLSVSAAILLIKRLLEKELAGTDGLIIDLRNNGGGTISFGESLVQLFTPQNIQPQGFRLQNTAVIRDLFAQIPTWSQDYRQALDVAQTIGARYTEALPLTTTARANQLGQSYFKPVAILTNSSCYSTCDMMTALMQDFAIATIWGEDGRTGAGGANNVQLNYFTDALTDGHNAPFHQLPAGQSMGVSWRQTVRVGKSSGVLLEEKGVRADALAPPSLADLFSDDLFQFRLISSELNRLTRPMTSWFRSELPSRVDFVANSTPAMEIIIADTEALQYRVAGASIGYEPVNTPASHDGIKVTARPPLPPTPGTSGSLEIIGYRSGKRVWRTMQDYRFVPEPILFNNDTRITMNFSTPAMDPMVVYTLEGLPSEGWSVQGGRMKAGLGDKYPDNLNTEAALFLDLTTRTSPVGVSFDIEGATEKDYDFFGVAAYAPSGKKIIVPDYSGEIPLQRISADLSEFHGQRVEIRFVFRSDTIVTDRGVAVSKLVIE